MNALLTSEQLKALCQSPGFPLEKLRAAVAEK
jgi:hypothetical protein